MWLAKSSMVMGICPRGTAKRPQTLHKAGRLFVITGIRRFGESIHPEDKIRMIIKNCMKQHICSHSPIPDTLFIRINKDKSSILI
jgi:hypothetical protein